MAETEKEGRVVIVTGPSGVGKSTIVREVVDRTGADFSVSVTTRTPRQGEVDNREYHFIDRGVFENMVACGEMLEWAEVFGELYGTPAFPVREAIREGRNIVLEIDVQGGLQIRQKLPHAVCVLIAPPSHDVLTQRLKDRGTEDEQKIALRLAESDAEVRAATESGAYDHKVINDDLETAIRQVVRIVSQESQKR